MSTTSDQRSSNRGEAFAAAVAQFYSGPDVEANLAKAIGFMREAAEQGARLIVMPENANRVRDFTTREGAWDAAESLDGVFISGLREAAAELGMFVVVGVDVRGERAPDVHIGVVLIDDRGEIVHVHHKTVFWDYEYDLFTPGTKQLEVIDTELGRIGMLSCADGIVPEPLGGAHRDRPAAYAATGEQIGRAMDELIASGVDFREHRREKFLQIGRSL